MEENIKTNTCWEAVYNNGESLLQFSPDGKENKYADIKRAVLKQFILYRHKLPAIVIHFDGAKRLIYRMRNAMNNHGYSETVYLAGWQETRDGKNTQMIAFLFEDGHIEIVDRFYADHTWFYAIRFQKTEEI